MQTKLVNYIKAGQPCICLLSSEEERVEAVMQAAAEKTGYRLYTWKSSEGLRNGGKKEVSNVNDPFELLSHIIGQEDKGIFLLYDYHLYLTNPEPSLIRGIKDTLRTCKNQNKTLVLLGCQRINIPELEHELVVVEGGLPSASELRDVVVNMCKENKLTVPCDADLDKLADAASGMTSQEAENAFALSLVEKGGKFDPVVINREKCATVKKGGLLEVLNPEKTLDDIGGLDNLKNFLCRRKAVFTKEAKAYGLPAPRGLLVAGVPGCGKTLTAKALATVFQRPLLRLDAGQLFSSLVGSSEERVRKVQATAEAVAPCILFIDELEKSLGGAGGSVNTDGGVANRVFGSFLSWLNDHTAPVFVVATANDVSKLPAEFLRAGRFDALFFVDLPTHKERETIWKIHIKAKGRDPSKFDVDELARASADYTGSEIEQAFINAMFDAFEQHEEVTTKHVVEAVERCIPLSRTAAEKIGALRQWAEGRAQNAGCDKEQTSIGKSRKVQVSTSTKEQTYGNN